MSDLSPHMLPKANVTIGLLTNFISYAVHRPQWGGFVEAARQHQVSSITYVGGTYRLPEHTPANFIYDLAHNDRTDGLVIWAGNMLWNVGGDEVNRFVAPYLAKKPVVCCEKPVEGAITVLMEDYEGMRQMVGHLIEVHGRRRIVFLQGPNTHLGAAERYRGYCDALADAGIPFDQALVSDASFDWSADELHIQNRLDALHLTPGSDYDAVVGASSLLAIMASNVLQKQGIAVPEQVSVAGFDDVIENIIQNPTLTTVRSPLYEMGQRAVQTVIDLLGGQTFDPVFTQPVQLVIRQSCGCIEKLVSSAALPEGTRQPTVMAGGLAALAAKRESWIHNIIQAFLGQTDFGDQHAIATRLSGEVRHLVDAFLSEVTGKAEGVFLKALRALLHQTGQMGGPVNAWQAVISALRHFILPYLDQKTRPLCENLWNQARVLIGEAAERAQLTRLIEQEQRTARQRELMNALIASDNVQQMMDRFAAALPGLNIPSCYVVLTSGSTDLAGQARLVLAYEQGERFGLPQDGQLFPARQLLPDDVYPANRVVSLLVEPLYLQDAVIGFVIFEAGPLDAALYETLRVQLSNALHKVQLVQTELDVRQKAEEKLRNEQMLFQGLMDNLPDVIYFKDRSSFFTRVNPAMAHYHGRKTPDDMVGKSDFDLFDDEHARPAYEDEQRIMQTLEPLLDFEEKEVYADGHVNWVSTSKMPLLDANGQVVGTFGISRDITARKQAEQQVEHRSIQLQTAAEVARAAGSILDLNQLSQQVVELIHERFKLYYVGLFLVDEKGEWTNEPNRWAVLRAGTGDAGQQMLAQGHKLELGGTSMIGWCVVNRQPRIALDVGQDAVRFRNPLLPLTRSELALPLISRGQVLGALSIQSTLGAAFSQEDITIFQVMADQLANAMSNARLYEATQEALQEMRATNRRYVSEGWQSFSTTRQNLGYEQNEHGLQPLGRQPLPEVQRAVSEQRSLTLKQDDSTLVVPIVLRDQPIGAVGFRSERADRRWTQEEVNMIEVLAEQFALAAENLRLLDDTQRRAERERLTANIAAHMRESLNMETILRTTVQEIQQALGLSEVVVHLKAPEQPADKPVNAPDASESTLSQV
jgi:PAS domain S-box-containing protein